MTIITSLYRVQTCHCEPNLVFFINFILTKDLSTTAVPSGIETMTSLLDISEDFPVKEAKVVLLRKTSLGTWYFLRHDLISIIINVLWNLAYSLNSSSLMWNLAYSLNNSSLMWNLAYSLNNSSLMWNLAYSLNSSSLMWNLAYSLNSSSLMWNLAYSLNSSSLMWNLAYSLNSSSLMFI